MMLTFENEQGASAGRCEGILQIDQRRGTLFRSVNGSFIGTATDIDKAAANF
jgi:hypothetical protein